MKKLLIASAVTFFGLATAQIEKGRVMIGGEVSYQGDRNNNTEIEKDTYRLVPQVGFFVADNFAIGVGAGYVDATTKDVAPAVVEKVGTSGFVVEPFARKYWTLGEKLYFFGQLSVPMTFGCENYKIEYDNFPEDNIDEETKFTSFGVKVKPGLTYFLNKNWSLDATIGEFGYESKKLDVEGAKSVDNLNLGLNLKSVSLGVKYVFGGNKAQ